MTTQVLIEEAHLDDGIAMIYKDFGTRVRIAFDPRRIAESFALSLLALYLPHLAGAMDVIHHIGA